MRIVSLCPSTTETLAAFGLLPALVGVTRFCIHPAAGVAAVPKVGGTKDPDLDRIVALRPDLVFLNAEENRREDHEVLRARLPASTTLDVSHPRRVAEVPALLRHFGAQTDSAAIAERYAAQLEAALDRLSALPGRPFRVAYLIWRKPWMAVGPDTYVSDLLARAGGENVLSDASWPVIGGMNPPAGATATLYASRPYPEVLLEALAAKQPELVLLPDEPFPFADQHLPEVQAALPHARLRLVSGDDCCWHGVRSIWGVELMCALRAELARGDAQAQ